MHSTPEQLMDLIKQLEQESDSIYNQIIDICYFMKGGVNWDQAWGMSFADRERIIIKLNKHHKEQSGDTKEQM